MSHIEITSFGYLHGPQPPAHIVLDLRHHFRDPDVDPMLSELTAYDEPVQLAVAARPGVSELLLDTVRTINAFRSGPTPGKVTVAIGCDSGRQLSAVIAMAVGAAFGLDDHAITHRDLSTIDPRGTRS